MPLAGGAASRRTGRSRPPRTASKDASADPARLAELFTDLNGAVGVGIATGAVSGLVVLDVDVQHGGAGTLRELEAKYGGLPRTFTVLTGGGGRHFYFAYPGEGEIRNSAGRLGHGLDVRGEGGYVVGAGSPHESGRRYKVMHDRPVAELPAWLLMLLRASERDDVEPHTPREHASDPAYGLGALRDACEQIRAAPIGTRDDTLNREGFGIGRLVGGGELLEATARRELSDAIEDLIAGDPACNAEKARGHLTRQRPTASPTSFEEGMAVPRTAPDAPGLTRGKRASPSLTRASESPESVGDSQGGDEGIPPPEAPFSIAVYSARELYAQPLPQENPQLVGPFLRRGRITLLGATTGHGKTTFGDQMLAAGANGGEFLGYECEGGLRELVLDLEQHLEDIKEQLDAVGLADSELVDYAPLPDGLQIDRESEHLAELERVIAAKPYDIVRIDPFYKLHAADSSDEEQARARPPHPRLGEPIRLRPNHGHPHPQADRGPRRLHP
jgi:hypothetical protein